MRPEATSPRIHLHYTLFCEDVRLEVNQKLSLMGMLYAIQVPQFPVTLLKIVVLNHWSGEGRHLSEVRILTPDRSQTVAVSPPAPFDVPANGFADNVTIFANITFPVVGNYVVQTLIDSNLFSEQILPLVEIGIRQELVTTETIQ